MMLSNQLKSQVTKIFGITLFWTFISLVHFLMAYSNLIDYNCDISSRSIWVPFKASLITGVIAGILGGSSLVFLWEKWLRTKPYGWTLKRIFLTYVVIFFVVTTATSLYFQVNDLQLSIWHSAVWRDTWVTLTSPTILVPFFVWLLVVVFTMIAFQVNDKYGPGVFKDFLLGKYFQPKKEERIFMFMDLRSSTTIAEAIGEEKYFNFLKDVFEIVTPGILKFEGEIYQYVGDELVVSWKMNKGIRRNNCIECFFRIQELLNARSDYFQTKYGAIPEFKAGLHFGHVMAGEIGVVKRDIVFSGDVLNTTSRIQEKCNEMKVDLLLSNYLVNQLRQLNNISLKEIGEIKLKGKAQPVVLYTI